MSENVPPTGVRATTEERLRKLAQRLCMRPNWRGNYGALAGNAQDGRRIELALLMWLRGECSTLLPEEIVKAELILVTRCKFAPDTSEIIRVLFQVAAQCRFGDERTVYDSTVAKTTRWRAGSKEAWEPVEAWLVKSLGARALCEDGYDHQSARVAEAIQTFVREGEPDVRDDQIFIKEEKNSVNFYASETRIRRDYFALKQLLFAA
jgi:hypothetical protein